eukprot:278506_1
MASKKYSRDVVEAMLSLERTYTCVPPCYQVAAAEECELSPIPSSNRCDEARHSPQLVNGFPICDDDEGVKTDDEDGCFSTLSDESIRDTICAWMFEVVDFCSFDRETIYIGMAYFDRFTSQDNRNRSIEDPADRRHRAQGVALTSLYLAVKIHDNNRKSVCLLKTFESISHDKFTSSDIYNMEITILLALEWKLHPPTPQAFMFQFLMALAKEGTKEQKQQYQIVHEVTNYITELTLRFLWQEFDNERMNRFKASTIAYASILIALKGVRNNVLSNAHFHHFNDELLSMMDEEAKNRVQEAARIIMPIIAEDYSSSESGIKKILAALDSKNEVYHTDIAFY